MRRLELITIFLLAASLVAAPFPQGGQVVAEPVVTPKACCQDGAQCCQLGCCLARPTAPDKQPTAPNPRDEEHKSQVRQKDDGIFVPVTYPAIVTALTGSFRIAQLEVNALVVWSLQAQHVRLEI